MVQLEDLNKTTLTVQMAAKELDRTTQAIQVYIKTGILPATLVHGRYLIRRVDWEEFLRKRTTHSYDKSTEGT